MSQTLEKDHAYPSSALLSKCKKLATFPRHFQGLRCLGGWGHAPCAGSEQSACSASYLYSFGIGVYWNINLELELIINAASGHGVPISFEAITISFHNILLKICFISWNKTLCSPHYFLPSILKKINTCHSIVCYLFTRRDTTHMLNLGNIF